MAKTLKDKIKEIVKDVYSELGSSDFFDEKSFQAALATGFKKAGLSYLKELHVEILYKGERIRPEGGYIDFMVFDKEEKEGILIELKHTTCKKDGSFGGESSQAVPQAWLYIKAIRDKEGRFPQFIGKKIKDVLVINLEKEGGAFPDLIGDKIEHVLMKGKVLPDKYFKNLEIWNIHSELTKEQKEEKCPQ